MSVRRNYLATPPGFYAVGASYVAIGIVLILFAPAPRMPKILRVLGAVTCARGIVAPLFGTVERALALLEWETMQGPGFLRAGAVVALATGGFVAYAVSPLVGEVYLEKVRKEPTVMGHSQGFTVPEGE